MRQGPVLLVAALAALIALHGSADRVLADGIVLPPRDYHGSLEERAQEAVIIFHAGKEPGEAVEDLILKITVQGDTRTFGWVVPLPGQPETGREDPRIFAELFNYVEHRLASRRKRGKGKLAAKARPGLERDAVDVLSRQVVGVFEVAVVREKTPGTLNRWLEREGFRTLADGEDVIAFYRRKGYVFACVKVSDAALSKDAPVSLHPLRFTFRTGGRDGIYFPMKVTGLQTAPFDVNLYVFYGAWLNDRLNRYGFVHRGFRLRYRDWDSPACDPNAGKLYSAPSRDPFLRSYAERLPTVTRLFQKRHPGERYYLTNLQARRLKPAEVRRWPADLWLFPYYTDPDVIPYDAREGGPASAVRRKS